MASEKVQTLSDTNFDSTISNSAVPVLVDFWAEWCAPCRRIAPSVDALASELDGKLLVGKLNVDDNPDVTMRFGVRGIPTLLLFKGGKVVDQVVGLVGKDDLKSRITPHLP